MKKAITQIDLDIFEELLEMYKRGEIVRSQSECFKLFSSKGNFHDISISYIENLDNLSMKELLEKLTLLLIFSGTQIDSTALTLTQMSKK